MISLKEEKKLFIRFGFPAHAGPCHCPRRQGCHRDKYREDKGHNQQVFLQDVLRWLVLLRLLLSLMNNIKFYV